MTKEEKIKEAWGKNYEEFKEHIDENGWAIYPHFQKHEMIESVRPLEFQENGSCWRPKSLQGIENNNGWIKIESEEDLPKNSGHYLIMVNNEVKIDLWVNYQNKFELWNKNSVTHYQPIEKPKPPIY